MGENCNNEHAQIATKNTHVNRAFPTIPASFGEQDGQMTAAASFSLCISTKNTACACEKQQKIGNTLKKLDLRHGIQYNYIVTQ